MDQAHDFWSWKQRQRADAYRRVSGHLGLGVIPENWSAAVTKAIRIGAGGAISSQVSNRILELTTNAWHNGTQWNYIVNDYATQYYQYLGAHVFNVAASGTANNQITFSEAMRIASNGRIGIGEISPDALLHLNFESGNPQIILERSSSATAKYALHAFSNSFTIRDEAQSFKSAYLSTASGNLGINNNNPSQRVHVSGNIELNAYDNTGGGGGYNTSSGLIIGNLYDAGKSYSGSDDRTACIWQERGLDLDFATNNTLRMKLTYDGKLGLGHCVAFNDAASKWFCRYLSNTAGRNH